MANATHHSAEKRKEASQPRSFSTLPNEAYARQPQVLEVVPFSPASLWRKCKASQFPAPVRLSARVTAWHVGSVRAWLEAQAKGVA